jgi:hypothetical protein
LREDLREFPRIPSLRDHPLRAAAWGLRASADGVALVVLLALTASIPVVNLLALGYLLEVQARVARSGKFRSAFYLLPAAGRLGGIVLGITLWLLPIRLLATAARDSWLLSPGSPAAWLWAAALLVASLLITSHLLLAIGCGGQWWRFLRPVNNARRFRADWHRGEYWRGAHQAIYALLAALRLPHLLWLGLLGFAATYLWLAVPTYLLTSLDDVTSRLQVGCSVVGGVLMTVTLMGMPFLLVHVASEGRPKAIFAATTVLELAGRTPLRWALATAVLLACSMLPLLYSAVFKNQIPPHTARWDLMLVFLLVVAPARVLVGWAYHRAMQTTCSAASWPKRIWQLANVTALAIGIGWYVYFLYLAQTGGEIGQRALWQFEALLLPWPF